MGDEEGLARWDAMICPWGTRSYQIAIMTTNKDKYTLARERAERMYHDRIKHELGEPMNGQWVVIDADSGDYEAADDLIEALDALEARVPNPDKVFVRDGEFTEGDLAGFGKVLYQSSPQDEQDAIPHDLSLNIDHYLYGLSKRQKYPWQE